MLWSRAIVLKVVLGVRMRMIPCVVPVQYVRMQMGYVEQVSQISPCSRRIIRLNRTWKWVPGLWRLSTTCFLLLHFLLPSWLLLYIIWLRCFLFRSVANCRLCSALDSAKHVTVHCGGPAALSSPSSIVKKRCALPIGKPAPHCARLLAVIC